MGLVAVTFKVMPEGPGTEEEIKAEIRKRLAPKDIREVPIAFGIKLLEVLLIIDDKEGIGSVEEKLRAIAGIASVESGDVTLL
jgi:elongation factor 1-beta